MSRAVLACGKVYVRDDEVFGLKVEPARVTAELFKDEEFVKLVTEFVKRRYGYDKVVIERGMVYVDSEGEVSDVFRVEVYLERCRAVMRRAMDAADRAMGF